ncbi:cytochrome P450 [Astrocystis sublimbata]|nr:cytochrome P450 [Astrocystis sublimbata]
MATWEAPPGLVKATLPSLAIFCFISLLYVLVFRAFFHPLASFPGPLLAKFTNLYAAYHAWKGDIHLDIWRCHQRYGDRVRYGPNRIIINTAEAVHDIYGHSANVRKIEAYKILSSQAANLFTLSDKAQHSRRRRVISQCFSDNTMRQWEPILLSKINQFCLALRNQHGGGGKWSDPLDMARQFNYLAFDAMTAVAFGADYNTIEEPKFRYVMEAVAETNLRLCVLFQETGLAFARLDRRLFSRSVFASHRFVKFLRRLLGTRLNQEASHKDLFSFLQKCTDPDTGESLNARELSTETATFLVAGTDTTATTMSATAHYLSGSPHCYKRAVEEIRSTFASVDEIRLGPKLNSCVFLRACIDEALRLSPPGGSSFWRRVDHGGAFIGGEFIPAGCEVGVGVYAMHHHAKYWDDPLTYKPERWLSDTEKAKEPDARSAYFPFHIGSRSCVGKPLALNQIMLGYARLLWEFEFRREGTGADSEDSVSDEYVLTEHISGQGKGPILCFKARV